MPPLSAWLTSPFLPAVALVAGAILLWLTRRFLPVRWPAVSVIHGALPIVSVLAAFIAIWMLRHPASPFLLLLIFPPTLGADLTLRMQLDAWGRLFGMSLLWPVLAFVCWAVVDSTGTEPQSDSPDWPQWLLLLAASFVALAAADWLTLVAALALFDIVYLATSGPRAQHGWSFMANSLGGLAILAAAFTLSRDGHSLALTGGDSLPTTVAWLITVAALVRLAPYPLHFWLSDSAETPSPAWRWPVRFSSPILGLYLLTRLTPPPSGAVPGARLALIVGLGGCLAAGLLAWLTAQREPRPAIPFIALFQINLALACWALLGAWHLSLWTALNLGLGTTALAIHQKISAGDEKPLTWQDATPGAVAVAALVGLPLTVGLFARLPLYGTLLTDKLIGGLVLILAAESLFVATLLRVWDGLRPKALLRRPQKVQRDRSTRGVMALLVAPLLLLGAYPPLAAWLTGLSTAGEGPLFLPIWKQPAEGGIGLWAALLLPLAMGYGLYRSEWAWPAEMIDVRAQLVSSLRLGWLHHAVDRLLSRVRQALWSVGAVLHGEGYLAWVALSLLLILLLVLSR